MGSIGADRGSSVKGINGYNVVTANGENRTFYFEKSGDTTYYRNSINGVGEPTPENMTEKEMIQRIQNNGGTVTKKTTKELQAEMDAYKKDREATNELLNNVYARNRGADQNNKAYRNTRKANRIARRR